MIPEEGKIKIQEAVDQLRQMSSQINEMSDAATATILRVEKFLNEECSIGMWGMVEQEKTDSPEVAAIRYDRFEGQFRILAQIKRGDEHWSFKPWVNCNRETKLKTFLLLPGLLNVIAQEGLALCKHIQETDQIVQDLTRAIDKR